MITEANDPINPVGSEHYLSLRGLTKREYFAAIILQGLLSNPKSIRGPVEVVIESSVFCADKLIKELNKEKP